MLSLYQQHEREMSTSLKLCDVWKQTQTLKMLSSLVTFRNFGTHGW